MKKISNKYLKLTEAKNILQQQAYYIKWRESSRYDGQYDASTDLKITEIEAVGFKISENDMQINLKMMGNSHGRNIQPVPIPKCAIVEGPIPLYWQHVPFFEKAKDKKTNESK